jgi:2-oxoglutarate ferredoxin oxidoreductase subunit gamma
MLENKEVTWFPSYGAEIRGGTANCTVIISDELIGSPIVAHPDILIVLNDASLKKFMPKLKKNGVLILDSSLIKEPAIREDIKVIPVPATEISINIGNTKSTNMVLLGVLIATTNLLKATSVFDALECFMKEGKRKNIDINRKAIIEGMRFIEDKKG